MNCVVHHSKAVALGKLVVLLSFVSIGAWLLPSMHEKILLFSFAFVMAALFARFLYELVTSRAIIRVDEAGVYDSRGWYPLIPWSDVVAVERKPVYSRGYNGQGYYYVTDAWRPILLTVRHPEKYQPWLMRFSPQYRLSPDLGLLYMNCIGLTPGSSTVEKCIQEYLHR